MQTSGGKKSQMEGKEKGGSGKKAEPGSQRTQNEAGTSRLLEGIMGERLFQVWRYSFKHAVEWKKNNKEGKQTNKGRWRATVTLSIKHAKKASESSKEGLYFLVVVCCISFRCCFFCFFFFFCCCFCCCCFCWFVFLFSFVLLFGADGCCDELISRLRDIARKKK